ncbi:MAG: glycosyltransferase family 2 protein [Armatimonadetes bacterium]|nr:glycosyltransferase family 2 protein [Armatimonadota bacterium]
MGGAEHAKKVSVILVSYNTAGHVLAALEALEGQAHEVIVVDNASRDKTVELVKERHPGVKLIINTRNRGFGAANNQALDAMTGDLALLLNSDCVPEPGAVAKLAEAFKDPSVVAAGGRLLNPDGSLQESACSRLTLWVVVCEQLLTYRLFPKSRVFNPYYLSARLVGGSGGPFHVAQVMGACLMMRPVARFDERFFLYCEDTELCLRLSRMGKIVYDPMAVFTHELGVSSKENRWWSVACYNYGKELYFRIHHGLAAQWACYAVNRLGALLRIALKPRGSRLWLRVLGTGISGPPLPDDA